MAEADGMPRQLNGGSAGVAGGMSLSNTDLVAVSKWTSQTRRHHGAAGGSGSMAVTAAASVLHQTPVAASTKSSPVVSGSMGNFRAAASSVKRALDFSTSSRGASSSGAPLAQLLPSQRVSGNAFPVPASPLFRSLTHSPYSPPQHPAARGGGAADEDQRRSSSSHLGPQVLSSSSPAGAAGVEQPAGAGNVNSPAAVAQLLEQAVPSAGFLKGTMLLIGRGIPKEKTGDALKDLRRKLAERITSKHASRLLTLGAGDVTDTDSALATHHPAMFDTSEGGAAAFNQIQSALAHGSAEEDCPPPRFIAFDFLCDKDAAITATVVNFITHVLPPLVLSGVLASDAGALILHVPALEPAALDRLFDVQLKDSKQRAVFLKVVPEAAADNPLYSAAVDAYVQSVAAGGHSLDTVCERLPPFEDGLPGLAHFVQLRLTTDKIASNSSRDAYKRLYEHLSDIAPTEPDLSRLKDIFHKDSALPTPLMPSLLHAYQQQHNSGPRLVRPVVSALTMQDGIQFGLVAAQPFKTGEHVTLFGGVLRARSEGDAEPRFGAPAPGPDSKTHVLDGGPFRAATRNFKIKHERELQALIRLSGIPSDSSLHSVSSHSCAAAFLSLLPSSRFPALCQLTGSALEYVDCEPLGHLAITAAPGTVANVVLREELTTIDGISQSQLWLTAKADIARDQRLILRSPFAPPRRTALEVLESLKLEPKVNRASALAALNKTSHYILQPEDLETRQRLRQASQSVSLVRQANDNTEPQIFWEQQHHDKFQPLFDLATAPDPDNYGYSTGEFEPILPALRVKNVSRPMDVVNDVAALLLRARELPEVFNSPSSSSPTVGRRSLRSHASAADLPGDTVPAGAGTRTRGGSGGSGKNKKSGGGAGNPAAMPSASDGTEKKTAADASSKTDDDGSNKQSKAPAASSKSTDAGSKKKSKARAAASKSDDAGSEDDEAAAAASADAEMHDASNEWIDPPGPGVCYRCNGVTEHGQRSHCKQCNIDMCPACNTKHVDEQHHSMEDVHGGAGAAAASDTSQPAAAAETASATQQKPDSAMPSPSPPLTEDQQVDLADLQARLASIDKQAANKKERLSPHAAKGTPMRPAEAWNSPPASDETAPKASPTSTPPSAAAEEKKNGEAHDANAASTVPATGSPHSLLSPVLRDAVRTARDNQRERFQLMLRKLEGWREAELKNPETLPPKEETDPKRQPNKLLMDVMMHEKSTGALDKRLWEAECLQEMEATADFFITGLAMHMPINMSSQQIAELKQAEDWLEPEGGWSPDKWIDHPGMLVHKEKLMHTGLILCFKDFLANHIDGFKVDAAEHPFIPIRIVPTAGDGNCFTNAMVRGAQPDWLALAPLNRFGEVLDDELQKEQDAYGQRLRENMAEVVEKLLKPSDAQSPEDRAALDFIMKQMIMHRNLDPDKGGMAPLLQLLQLKPPFGSRGWIGDDTLEVVATLLNTDVFEMFPYASAATIAARGDTHEFLSGLLVNCTPTSRIASRPDATFDHSVPYSTRPNMSLVMSGGNHWGPGLTAADLFTVLNNPFMNSRGSTYLPALLLPLTNSPANSLYLAPFARVPQTNGGKADGQVVRVGSIVKYTAANDPEHEETEQCGVVVAVVQHVANFRLVSTDDDVEHFLGNITEENLPASQRMGMSLESVTKLVKQWMEAVPTMRPELTVLPIKYVDGTNSEFSSDSQSWATAPERQKMRVGLSLQANEKNLQMSQKPEVYAATKPPGVEGGLRLLAWFKQFLKTNYTALVTFLSDLADEGSFITLLKTAVEIQKMQAKCVKFWYLPTEAGRWRKLRTKVEAHFAQMDADAAAGGTKHALSVDFEKQKVPGELCWGEWREQLEFVMDNANCLPVALQPETPEQTRALRSNWQPRSLGVNDTPPGLFEDVGAAQLTEVISHGPAYAACFSALPEKLRPSCFTEVMQRVNDGDEQVSIPRFIEIMSQRLHWVGERVDRATAETAKLLKECDKQVSALEKRKQEEKDDFPAEEEAMLKQLRAHLSLARLEGNPLRHHHMLHRWKQVQAARGVAFKTAWQAFYARNHPLELKSNKQEDHKYLLDVAAEGSLFRTHQHRFPTSFTNSLANSSWFVECNKETVPLKEAVLVSRALLAAGSVARPFQLPAFKELRTQLLKMQLGQLERVCELSDKQVRAVLKAYKVDGQDDWDNEEKKSTVQVWQRWRQVYARNKCEAKGSLAEAIKQDHRIPLFKDTLLEVATTGQPAADDASKTAPLKDLADWTSVGEEMEFKDSPIAIDLTQDDDDHHDDDVDNMDADDDEVATVVQQKPKQPDKQTAAAGSGHGRTRRAVKSLYAIPAKTFDLPTRGFSNASFSLPFLDAAAGSQKNKNKKAAAATELKKAATAKSAAKKASQKKGRKGDSDSEAEGEAGHDAEAEEEIEDESEDDGEAPKNRQSKRKKKKKGGAGSDDEAEEHKKPKHKGRSRNDASEDDDESSSLVRDEDDRDEEHGAAVHADGEEEAADASADAKAEFMFKEYPIKATIHFTPNKHKVTPSTTHVTGGPAQVLSELAACWKPWWKMYHKHSIAQFGAKGKVRNQNQAALTHFVYEVLPRLGAPWFETCDVRVPGHPRDFALLDLLTDKEKKLTGPAAAAWLKSDKAVLKAIAAAKKDPLQQPGFENVGKEPLVDFFAEEAALKEDVHAAKFFPEGYFETEVGKAHWDACQHCQADEQLRDVRPTDVEAQKLGGPAGKQKNPAASKKASAAADGAALKSNKSSATASPASGPSAAPLDGTTTSSRKTRTSQQAALDAAASEAAGSNLAANPPAVSAKAKAAELSKQPATTAASKSSLSTAKADAQPESALSGKKGGVKRKVMHVSIHSDATGGEEPAATGGEDSDKHDAVDHDVTMKDIDNASATSSGADAAAEELLKIKTGGSKQPESGAARQGTEQAAESKTAEAAAGAAAADATDDDDSDGQERPSKRRRREQGEAPHFKLAMQMQQKTQDMFAELISVLKSKPAPTSTAEGTTAASAADAVGAAAASISGAGAASGSARNLDSAFEAVGGAEKLPGSSQAPPAAAAAAQSAHTPAQLPRSKGSSGSADNSFSSNTGTPQQGIDINVTITDSSGQTKNVCVSPAELKEMVLQREKEQQQQQQRHGAQHSALPAAAAATPAMAVPVSHAPVAAVTLTSSVAPVSQSAPELNYLAKRDAIAAQMMEQARALGVVQHGLEFWKLQADASLRTMSSTVTAPLSQGPVVSQMAPDAANMHNAVWCAATEGFSSGYALSLIARSAQMHQQNLNVFRELMPAREQQFFLDNCLSHVQQLTQSAPAQMIPTPTQMQLQLYPSSAASSSASSISPMSSAPTQQYRGTHSVPTPVAALFFPSPSQPQGGGSSSRY